MTQLILHIGTHKTGSTSIQDFFLNNQDALLKNGILFPCSGRMDNSNHAPLAWEFNRFSKKYHNNKGLLSDWLKVFDEINENQCKFTVISSEEFSVLDSSAIKSLNAALQEKGIQSKIFIFVRCQREVLRSNYIELLKQGIIDIDMSSFIAESYFQMSKHFSLVQFDYRRMLEPWIETFGKSFISVLQYSGNNDVVSTFCKMSNIDINSIENRYPWAYLNTSPNRDVVNTLLYANRYLRMCRNMTPGRRTQISYDTYKKALVRYPDSAPFNGYTDEILRVVRDYYASSNRWLEIEFDIYLNGNNKKEDKYSISLNDLSMPICELDYWHNILRMDAEYSLAEVSHLVPRI